MMQRAGFFSNWRARKTAKFGIAGMSVRREGSCHAFISYRRERFTRWLPPVPQYCRTTARDGGIGLLSSAETFLSARQAMMLACLKSWPELPPATPSRRQRPPRSFMPDDARGKPVLPIRRAVHAKLNGEFWSVVVVAPISPCSRYGPFLPPFRCHHSRSVSVYRRLNIVGRDVVIFFFNVNYFQRNIQKDGDSMSQRGNASICSRLPATLRTEFLFRGPFQ